MTIRFSTGTFEKLLGDAAQDSGANGVRGIFKYGIIELRSGSQPATADAAPTGTLMGIITVGGNTVTPGNPLNGLSFSAPSGTTLTKTAAETWKFTALVTGTIGWFRLKGNAYDGDLLSTSLPRIDGSVGLSGAGDLTMTTASVTTGITYTLDDFSLTLTL